MKPRGNQAGRKGKAGSSALLFGIAAIVCACLIFYMSSQSDIPDAVLPTSYLPDKLLHFLEFALFGGLLFMSFASAGWRPWDAPLAIVLGAIYGMIDELHQFFVPGRVPDPMDALMNCFGVLTAVLILALLDRRLHPSQTLGIESKV